MALEEAELCCHCALQCKPLKAGFLVMSAFVMGMSFQSGVHRPTRPAAWAATASSRERRLPRSDMQALVSRSSPTAHLTKQSANSKPALSSVQSSLSRAKPVRQNLWLPRMVHAPDRSGPDETAGQLPGLQRTIPALRGCSGAREDVQPHCTHL